MTSSQLLDNLGFAWFVGVFVVSGIVLAGIDRLLGLPVLGLAVLFGGGWLLWPTIRAGFPLSSGEVIWPGIALILFCILAGYVGGYWWLKRRRLRS